MMKSKKLISAILAAASIAGGVVGAQAQDVGSLDSKVNNVIRDLNKQNDKIAALENKVNGIDTTRQVEAEATARKDADQKLQTNINAEATARKDADTKLQKQIDKNGFKADTALKVAGNGVMYNHANNLTDGVNENTKKIDAETDARVDADKKLNAKIDSNAVKVQEQLDAQNNKNKAQDESIKANGAAIKANKDAIKANADAIKANKAEADATNKYFNSRIENNTANIDNNKVAIENEVTARKDADTKLQTQIGTNKQQISQNQQNIGKNSSAIKTLQDNWKDSNRAFNAEQVQKIDSNEANINLLHRRVDDQQKQIDKNGIKADTALKVAGNGVMYNHANNLTDGVNENTKKIDAETDARVDADKKLNAKIDSNAVKVQEQLDAQNNKNKAQDESIKANGAAIKANKDAIKANADAIKANKAEADATNKYFNSRIENNTANIDNNKVAIENEVTARKDADQKLQTNINAEATARKDADTKLQKQIDKNGFKADTALKVAGNGVLYNHATNLTDGVNLNTKGVNENAKKIDAEATARKDADTKLQANIEKETADRIAGDNALNSRIGQVESDATKGIAKASALAALHPLDYDPDNKFDIAAAGGFYKGENAFALGAFYRPNRNVMLSMGTTLTSGDNAYNVGLTFKIGKSGKHTEAGLTTADLYAMIGAMQDKMDQQQKKIEELEAKQAK